MNASKKSRGKVGGWIKRHKLITAMICLVLVASVVGGAMLLGRGPSEKERYAFIRTVTLSRNALEETIDCSGVVQSANTSTVTYSATAMSGIPKVKTLNVVVGDSVLEGDVLVVLDTADIEKSIADEKEAMEDRAEQYKKAYDKAIEAHEDAKEDYEQSEADFEEAKVDFETAKKKYDAAEASVRPFQDTYDLAFEEQIDMGLAYNAAIQAYNDKADEVENLTEAEKEAYDQWMDKLDAVTRAPDDQKALAERLAKMAENSYVLYMKDRMAAQVKLQELAEDVAEAKKDYEEAVAETQAALLPLNQAMSVCNYAAYKQEYSQAEALKNSTEMQFKQAKSALEAAEDNEEKAKENYENVYESDLLDDLYEQLDACSLKAETDGKVTALNVSVGDAPSGVIAMIQNTDHLKIAITVPEADIHKISLGMACRISSDATEGDISGTLTQIDPVAGQSGGFGAEVTVNGTDSGLLIGMNANAEIIVSSTENCFSVPRDAVGNDDDGLGDYIYRRTGGSGVDMTFEKVYVTAGNGNDYYVEVDAPQLAEGDVIRATADLSAGIEKNEAHSAEDAFEDAFGAGMGNMPMGGGMSGGMSGGMPGGGMPGGMRG